MDESTYMESQELFLSNNIFILRHGKTEWNQEGRMQGQLNSPLLISSKEELKKIGTYLNYIEFDIVFHSPLERVIQSLAYLELNANKTVPNIDLVELNHGVYEGVKETDIDSAWQMERAKDKWNTPWPKGESYYHVDLRVKKFIDTELLNMSNKTIAIVAHETINKILIGNLMKLPQQKTMELKHPNSVVFKIAHNVVSFVDISTDFKKNMLITKV